MFKLFTKKKTANNAIEFGKEAEKRAVKFLKKNGLEVLEQNYHSRFGEIDIIAQDKNILHFIEVKATNAEYDPLYRITTAKMEKIIKTVEFYLLKNSIQKEYQIDAVIVNKGEIEWIKNICY
ncbi:MAG: YraN family protein [Campylobacteraceae bacterium]|jgi:putative endonuclease|nr:YraN family protein [Campylobacteraceae bacterium]